MGSAQRPRPARLAAKLTQIRAKLGLTQEEMRLVLKYGSSPKEAGHISRFETGKREPPLPTLLRYARVAGVAMEILVDDELDLPDKLRAVKNTPGRTRKLAGESSRAR